MLKTKARFVDGLPEIGRTTPSRWLNQRLGAEGVETRLLSEYTTPHPLRWFRFHGGVEYLPPDFETALLATHMGNSIRKWLDFSSSIQDHGEVLTIDGYPFLNTVGILLWGDADEKLITDYMDEVHGIIDSTCVVESLAPRQQEKGRLQGEE